MHKINKKIHVKEDTMLEIYKSKEYGKITYFDPGRKKDMGYITEKIIELLHPKRKDKPSTDWQILEDPTIIFPDNMVESAQVLLALSMFKSFVDQGLLTEEEYQEFEKIGEKKWQEIMFSDSMVTKKVE